MSEVDLSELTIEVTKGPPEEWKDVYIARCEKYRVFGVGKTEADAMEHLKGAVAMAQRIKDQEAEALIANIRARNNNRPND